MRYCQSCILPDTRPNLVIGDDGICNACKNTATKPDIDWQQREKEFQSVVERAKAHSQGYDCIIPVSGGKDSHWQTLKALEYGLKPLCVTWKTPCRTDIGQKNLDNLISIGVDHLDVQINPEVEKKFTWLAFKKYGTTALPMHMALFSIPLRFAVQMNIPLVLWGENSAFEYGGADSSLQGFKLNREWLKTYGVTHGTFAEGWVGDELSEKDLVPYKMPTDKELEGTLAAFLGYYFEWDPVKVYEDVKQHGFQAAETAKTGLYKFADIDDDFIITLHHFMKWYKFGFTRLWDNLSLEIRGGRLTREKAIEMLKEAGDITPAQEIEKFCAYVGVTRAAFDEVVDGYRNLDIWDRQNGKWVLKDFLIDDWKWS